MRFAAVHIALSNFFIDYLGSSMTTKVCVSIATNVSIITSRMGSTQPFFEMSCSCNYQDFVQFLSISIFPEFNLFLFSEYGFGQSDMIQLGSCMITKVGLFLGRM